MRLINRLLSFSVSQCGLCCCKQYQCESCLKSMLRTAGLNVDKYLHRVKNKKSKNPAYTWNDYSEVIIEMRKIISEQENKGQKMISKRVKDAVKKVLYNSKNSKKAKVARGEALTQRGKK